MFVTAVFSGQFSDITHRIYVVFFAIDNCDIVLILICLTGLVGRFYSIRKSLGGFSRCFPDLTEDLTFLLMHLC